MASKSNPAGVAFGFATDHLRRINPKSLVGSHALRILVYLTGMLGGCSRKYRSNLLESSNADFVAALLLSFIGVCHV